MARPGGMPHRGVGLCFLPAALLWGCVAWEAPGEGEDAALGFRRAAPLIAALGRYRADQDRYPHALAALVPRYVPAAALEGPGELSPFRYRLVGDGYELRFDYSGPGSNRCTFASQALDWECDGLF